MKKFKIIVLFMIVVFLGSCATNNSIVQKNKNLDSIKIKSYEEQRIFLIHNIKCEEKYESDKYNTVDAKVFRCGVNDSSDYIEIITDGPMSNKVVKARLVWKNWENHLNFNERKKKSSQLIASFGELYYFDKTKFIESFYYDNKTVEFDSNLYGVKMYSLKRKRYTVRIADVFIND